MSSSKTYATPLVELLMRLPDARRVLAGTDVDSVQRVVSRMALQTSDQEATDAKCVRWLYMSSISAAQLAGISRFAQGYPQGFAYHFCAAPDSYGLFAQRPAVVLASLERQNGPADWHALGGTFWDVPAVASDLRTIQDLICSRDDLDSVPDVSYAYLDCQLARALSAADPSSGGG